MAVPGYSSDRKNETFSDHHGYSDEQLKRKSARTRVRKRNREPGMFGKVNWDSYQHHQLYDMIMTANVREMSTRANQWHTLAGKISETTGEVQRVMQRMMGGWRGNAAVAAAESSTRLMQWADEASHTAQRVAKGMADYTDAVGEAQTKMPDPAFASAEQRFRDGYSVNTTGGPSTALLLRELMSDGMASHEQARSSKAEAVQVMETYESRSRTVHDEMPHFTDAQAATTAGGQQLVPPNTGATPGGTTAAGYAAPAAPPGGAGLPGAGTSGGADLARGPATGLGPGGLGPGGPLAARGGAAAAGARGAGAAVRGAAAGARGGPAAMGGAPGGRGGEGDGDKHHRNKYDEGLDLFDDLPPAYPSVFGA